MHSYTPLAIAYSGYFFFCTVPHTSAARYSFLGFALLAALFAIYTHRDNLTLRSPIAYAVCGFTLIAGLSAVISPYLLESISDFRKDYLTPGLLILLTSVLPWTREEAHRFITFLISAISIGFLAKAILAFWDGAINHPWIFSPYSNPAFFEQHGLPRYVSFFAVEASLYLPLLTGVLLFRSSTKKLSILILIGLLLGYGIILVSGIRSSFLVTTVGIIFLMLVRYAKPRHILALAVVAILSAGALFHISKTNLEVQRYVEIFKPDSYSKEKGMSDRYPIWVATYELVTQRPLLGFGPGWKKIPTVANDTGLLGSWRDDSSYYGQRKSYWFSLSPGQTNPHNLAMQLLFETGWIGLLFYLSILVSLLISTRVNQEPRDNSMVNESYWLSKTVPVFLLCYLTLCITNGFLFPVPLVLLLVIVAVQYKSNADKNLVSFRHT